MVVWLVLLLLTLSPAVLVRPAAGQTLRTDPVVVTATKTETPQERLGAAVTVITGDHIEEKQYPTVEEALRHVPGVDIQRSGGLGKTTAIRIRGTGTQQVQVMVDGLRVKSPTLGTAELSDLSIDNIDRIEIVRGPQSTIHGADAIGGVINIITRKGQGAPRGTVRVEAGTFETYREQATFSGSYRAFSYSLSGSHYDTRGYLKNDDATQSAFSGRFDYDFPWAGTLTLSGRYSKTETDLPIFSTLPQTVFDPNSQQQSETWLYNLAYSQKVTDWWATQLRYGQWLNRSGFQNPPPPGTFTTISQINTERREAEWLNTLRLVPWNTLTIGAEHRDEIGRNRGTFRKELITHSLFAQDELRLGDRVILGGGLRHEFNNEYSEATTGRASFVLLVPETGTKVRGAWGEGFRAPTINDLFFPGFGNSGLRPESSTSYEIGVDQRVWDNRIRFGATAFHNDFTDLIQIVQIPGTFIFQPQNVGQAVTEGVEFYSEADPLDVLTLYATYTYTVAEDRTTHKPLRRVPMNRYTAGASFTWDKLRLFAEATIVSEQFESATNLKSYNPGHHRVDVGGSYQLWGRAGVMERAELIARFNNITNEGYKEVFGFPAPGFNCMIGLRVAFQ
ncbi:MAG: TonB-dependent receptor [Candidatus Rokubacteria bacterium]|nr:TonB-dependent receptor [Candidatus Rokubacteria bacterium]